MHRSSRSRDHTAGTSHIILRIALVCGLALLNVLPAFSQFLTTKVSQRAWGIKDPSRIEVVQVSVIRGGSGDSLLIYALRDTVPPPLIPPIVGRAPSVHGKYFIISDFAYSQVNTLGGVFDSFQREPSSSSARLADTRDEDRALRFTFDKKKEGYCGLWIQLFNSFDSPAGRNYLDTRPFSALSFWIRGEAGHEHLMLKVADARWIQKEDAVNIGDVGRFIPGGKIDTSWRLAVIPLDKIPASVDKSQLGSLVFEADSIGTGRVEIKTLALCKDLSQTPPLTRSLEPAPLEGSRKAIWVWETQTFAGNSVSVDRFVDVLVQHRFTDVFLAIPYETGEATQSGSLPVRHGVLDSLLTALHSKKIKVDALMGDRNFTLPEWHGYVLSTMKNIERFNTQSLPSARFDGIHLDVEPYLLPGFNGPRHEELLKDYLELLSKVCSEAHNSNLTVGADIPFWYSEPDEFTHTVGTIAFRGSEKPVYQHVLDMVDNIAVMSYRTTSSGIDGIIAHTLDELMYGQQVGKKVFVGLETGPISDERIVTFRGQAQTGEIASPQADNFFLVPSDDTLTFYLITEHQAKDFASFLQFTSNIRRSVYHWTSTPSTLVPGARLSFATLGIQELRRTMHETFLELGQYKSFGGFAVHYYSSYRTLLKSAHQ